MALLSMKVGSFSPVITMALDVATIALRHHLESMDARFSALEISADWSQEEDGGPIQDIFVLGPATDGYIYKAGIRILADDTRDGFWKPVSVTIVFGSRVVATYRLDLCGNLKFDFIELPETLRSVRG